MLALIYQRTLRSRHEAAQVNAYAQFGMSLCNSQTLAAELFRQNK